MSHHAPLAPILYSFPDSTELVDSVAEFVLKAQNDAIKRRGAFTLAISGGSLPGNLKGLIGKEGVLFDKWCVVYPISTLRVMNVRNKGMGWEGREEGGRDGFRRREGRSGLRPDEGSHRHMRRGLGSSP